MLKGKKVFVSGGAGVIGRTLIQKLHEAGCVLFVGDLQPRPADWDAVIRYRQGDLNHMTQEELDDFSPELFFHLAATFERSTETYGFWDENYDHNVRLSHHLMTLMKQNAAVKKVVFASSYLIYDPVLYSFEEPAAQPTSLKETDPIRPRNMCGAAKLLHEVELEFLGHFQEHGLQTVYARIFRSYGRGSRDIISRWVRMLLKNEPITVYKKEGLFDYIYADDVAEGLMRLAEQPVTGIVNLGSGRSRRVEEVVEVLRNHFPDMKVTEGDLDIPYEGSQADMTRFREQTGWVPARQIEDTIPEIIAFEKAAAQAEATLHQSHSRASGNVLVTSISRKVPLLQAVKRAVSKLGGERKVIGADLDADCIGRHFVDDFWQMPRLSELTMEQFAAFCMDKGITAVIPTRDGELCYFAKHREDLLERGISVMVSGTEAVLACLDKLAFYERLNEAGYPVIPASGDIDEIQTDLYVVKERYGAGSQSVGLQLSRDDAELHAQRLQAPIFQPYIAGTEVSIDLYVDRSGRTKGVVARTRDKVMSGESQVTTTVRNEELETLCARIAEHLQLYGHIVMQAMIDPSGRIHLIECNTRFGGASTLSIAAGLDSFYWYLLETAGGSIGEYPFLRSRGEKKLVRYAEDKIV